jgi:hypothetical protein
MDSHNTGDGTVEVRLTVDGRSVWAGSVELSEQAGGNGNPIQIGIELGPKIADRAREQMHRRLEEGPSFEGKLEDVLWEYIDVELSELNHSS